MADEWGILEISTCPRGCLFWELPAPWALPDIKHWQGKHKNKNKIFLCHGKKNEKKRSGNLKTETPTHFAEKNFCFIIELSRKSHDLGVRMASFGIIGHHNGK